MQVAFREILVVGSWEIKLMDGEGLLGRSWMPITDTFTLVNEGDVEDRLLSGM